VSVLVDILEIEIKPITTSLQRNLMTCFSDNPAFALRENNFSFIVDHVTNAQNMLTDIFNDSEFHKSSFVKMFPDHYRHFLSTMDSEWRAFNTKQRLLCIWV
jgi:hypothetical protein